MRGVQVVESCEKFPDERMGKKQADGAIQELKKQEARTVH